MREIRKRRGRKCQAKKKKQQQQEEEEGVVCRAHIPDPGGHIPAAGGQEGAARGETHVPHELCTLQREDQHLSGCTQDLPIFITIVADELPYEVARGGVVHLDVCVIRAGHDAVAILRNRGTRFWGTSLQSCQLSDRPHARC